MFNITFLVAMMWIALVINQQNRQHHHLFVSHKNVLSIVNVRISHRTIMTLTIIRKYSKYSWFFLS